MNTHIINLFDAAWLLRRRTPRTLTFVQVRDGIAGFRQILGLRQAEMAKELGISASTLSKLERGDSTCSQELIVRARDLVEKLQ